MEHMWEMMTFCTLRKPIGQGTSTCETPTVYCNFFIIQVLPSDLFGGLKWPFQGLSDLHLGDQKVNWKKLMTQMLYLGCVLIFFFCSALLGEMIQFEIGWNHQLVMKGISTQPIEGKVFPIWSIWVMQHKNHEEGSLRNMTLWYNF